MNCSYRALGFAIALCATPARAQPAPDSPGSSAHDDSRPWARGVSAAEQAVALELFAAGNAEFIEARYVQALAKYNEAIGHWDHPAIRYNIAICSLNLGLVLEAKDNFDRSLSHGALPLGRNIYEAGLRAVKRLEAQLAELAIAIDQPGIEVMLDGKPLLTAPGAPRQFVLPGTHQVVATRPGFPSLSSTIVLGSGTRASYVVRRSVKLRGGKLQASLELEVATATSVSASTSVIPDGPTSRAAASQDLAVDLPLSRRWSRLRSAPRATVEIAVGPALVVGRSETDGIDPITGLPVASPGGAGASSRWSARTPAFSIGVGVSHPISDRVDLSARLLAAAFSPGEGLHFTAAYAGTSIQYWWKERAWIGFGHGVMFATVEFKEEGTPSYTRTGIGFPLAAGYAAELFPAVFSVEVIPTVFPRHPGGAAVIAAAFVGFAIP